MKVQRNGHMYLMNCIFAVNDFKRSAIINEGKNT